MASLDCELRTLQTLNFSHFLNVKMLKIIGINMTKTKAVVVDLSRLVHLKSLDVTGRHLQRLVSKGLPKRLFFLLLDSDFDEVRSDVDCDSNAVESGSSGQLSGGFKEHCNSGSNSHRLTKQIASMKDLQYLL